MNRIAPAGGYDYGSKRQYRRDLWGAIRTAANNRSQCRVLFMPSSEGAEIPLILNAGFREDNLYAVDRNPALLATAAWRKNYPRIHVYGSELPRACERMAGEGIHIDIASMDLCNSIGSSMFRALSKSIATGVFYNPCLFSITMLRGREKRGFVEKVPRLLKNPDFSEALGLDRFISTWVGPRDASDADLARLGLAFGTMLLTYQELVPTGVEMNSQVYRTSSYRSEAGSQTMLWSLFMLHAARPRNGWS